MVWDSFTDSDQGGFEEIEHKRLIYGLKLIEFAESGGKRLMSDENILDQLMSYEESKKLDPLADLRKDMDPLERKKH